MNISPTMSPKHAPDLWRAAEVEYREDPRILEIMRKYFDQPIHCRVVTGSDACELTLSWGYKMRFSDYTHNRANAKAFLEEVRKVHGYYFPVTGPSVNDIKTLDFSRTSNKMDNKKYSKDAYEPPKDEFLQSLHAMVETKPFGEVYALLVERIGFDPLDINDARRKILEELKITSKNLSTSLSCDLDSMICSKLNSCLPDDYPNLMFQWEHDGYYLKDRRCGTFENIDELFLKKIAHILLYAGFSLIEKCDELKRKFQKKLEKSKKDPGHSFCI